MTGQDFRDKLDAIVADLQTAGKGQSVNVMFRGENGAPDVLPLSSDVNGVVNATQLQVIQDFIGDMGNYADAYTTAYAPVQDALRDFKTAQAPHEALMTAATNARKNLGDALTADAGYQAAKTALDDARADASYISARTNYANGNVSENFSELSNAKGKYAV